MTKKSNTTATANNQLLVYGLDEAGKSRGARFPVTEIDNVSPIVTALKLQSCQPASDEAARLGQKLPVGRIYARGKAFIPNIKRDLYDQLLAALASGKQEERSKAEPASGPATGQKTGNGTADASAAVPQPLASGLPQDWQSIASGNMVLADEGGGEGWWEAIVIARDNDILTLRYRDYPKVPKFQRHISTIALINPRPA